MIPQVVQVLAGEDFTVYIYFLDGAIRLLDAKPLLKQGGIFSPLRDEVTFRNSLTVMNSTVAWDLEGTRDTSACIDLDPCELYDNCPSAIDPLQEVISKEALIKSTCADLRQKFLLARKKTAGILTDFKVF